jgi:RNA polymerase sigma factor (sigma-70 family)
VTGSANQKELADEPTERDVLAVRPEAPDAEVIAASRRDPNAFALLYDRYAAQLYQYANRRVGRDVAQDVVAETFLAAFKAREGYDTSRHDARPWLFAIMTQQLALHYRTEKSRYRTLSRAGHHPGEEEFADRVDGYISAQATRAPLATALAGLAARDRDVLLLIAWGELTYDEVAQALDIPVGTVRSRLNRARRKLQAALANDNVIEVPR